MTRQRFKAWITKYALTEGLFEIDAEDCFDISKTMINELNPETMNRTYRTFHGSDWHCTREEAVTHADKMRLNKIESLKKQIAKLEKQIFLL